MFSLFNFQKAETAEITMVDVGDVSNGQDMIKISRRNAYLSSEGTAVLPSTTSSALTQESLRAFLLDLFSKPDKKLHQDDIVQVDTQNRIDRKQPDEL